MVPFDKFNDWMRTVCAHPGLTSNDKLVLSYIAVFYVRHGEDTFCVKQSTIAERCAISRKAVNSTMSRAKHVGFLTVNRRRQRGTGRHGADELRLTLPELSNELSHHSKELGNQSSHHSRDSSETVASCQTQSDVTKTPELCNQNGQSDVTKTPELCNRTNLPTSGNNTPTGSKTGLSTGFESRVLRARDADPRDGDVIEAEIVDDDRPQTTTDIAAVFGGFFGRSAAAAQRAVIPAESGGCTLCDDTGLLDAGLDARGNEQMQKCVCRGGGR